MRTTTLVIMLLLAACDGADICSQDADITSDASSQHASDAALVDGDVDALFVVSPCGHVPEECCAIDAGAGWCADGVCGYADGYWHCINP